MGRKWTLLMLGISLVFCLQPGAKALESSGVKDIIGVADGEGETVLFTFMQNRFFVRLSNYVIPGMPLLDLGKVSNLAKAIQKQVGLAPQSAYINDEGRIVGHLSGIILDETAFIAVLQRNLYLETELIENLPVRFSPPRVRTEDLKQSMERMIASFTTYYNSGNMNRSHNLKLASKSIHHYVVLPGETFSFNKVVGMRTPNRGYKRAPVIVRGEMSEDIGGGICQISSTLYNAADRAGLTIVSRYSHSKQVGYVPPGRDATVSWGGPDFVFRNDYDHPIMIKSYAQNGITTVQIYSSRSMHAELRNTPEAPKALPRESQFGL